MQLGASAAVFEIALSSLTPPDVATIAVGDSVSGELETADARDRFG